VKNIFARSEDFGPEWGYFLLGPAFWKTGIMGDLCAKGGWRGGVEGVENYKIFFWGPGPGV